MGTNLDMVYYLFRSYMTGAFCMFEQLDIDGDGNITEEELKTVFHEEDFDIKKFIEAGDEDGDKKIDFKAGFILGHIFEGFHATTPRLETVKDDHRYPQLLAGSFSECLR